MTGEDLLQKLLAMTPEQRKRPIATTADDVGRHRATVNYLSERIRATTVSLGYDEDEGEAEVLLID